MSSRVNTLSHAHVHILLLLLLLLQALQVELELSALQQDTISTAGLAWAARNARKHATLTQLIGDRLLNPVVAAAARPLALKLGRGLAHVVLVGSGVSGLLALLLRGGGDLGALLIRIQVDAVVLGVPALERRGIHDDDAVLHQRLRTHQLVRSGVVHDIEKTHALRDGLGCPGKVAGVQAQGTDLEVATASAHRAHAAGAKAGVRGKATKLSLHALPVDLGLSTGDLALMQAAADDAHGCGSSLLFIYTRRVR
ncbi:40S ribosomal protein S8, putative [Leishmania tarentolae]|uniref:40S ribosomal protein S8, putative n=1 Tax=Leishmania tarentolae TaxID=5689 RepID=A0A640KNN4_LEITA|nr:40S ribosomal protein S8, putative [Leishmania tarentolae]